MKTSVLILGVLAAIGCGSVTAKSDADGGIGGAGGKIGVESGSGGASGGSSSTGGSSQATGGAASGAGGAQATGGLGGAAAAGTGGATSTGGIGAGGNPGTGGITCSGSLSLCGASCVALTTDTNCGSCGHSCTPGQACTNGVCAESCASWGWTPSGCTSCPSGTKAGKACSVCTNEPSWFTGSSFCQDGDASGFLVAASCAACASL